MKNKRPDKKLHVLFVLENYWPNIGGVENLFKSLAENLSRQGHRVTVITTQLSKSDPPVETIENIVIRRYRFFNRYFFTLFAFFPVWRHAGVCDLVHTTSYNAALPAFLAARLRGRKVIVTFHEVWASLWFRLPFMGRVAKMLHFLFEQMLLRLPFDCFVGVSKSTAANLERAGVSPGRIQAIYNGIDYPQFIRQESAVQPQRPTHFTYTYFGRLGISKGLDILLDAARLFREKYPDTCLKMIIPKTPEGFFRLILAEIEKRQLTGYVELQHHLSFEELKAALLASDCVVIPSLSEGFCFAAVESVALGVPVISSGKGALSEVVSGLFIEMKTLTAEALAEALEQGRAGEWQQTPVKQFHLADTIEEYLALYGNVGFSRRQ